MTDQSSSQAELSQAVPSGMKFMQESLDSLYSTASVEAVYGKPVKNGDTLIIPTAEVLNVSGFGFGSGSGPAPDDSSKESGGIGGGGGGRVFSRPVAIVVASSEGVRVEPVIDVTKIGLAAITAFGFMFSMLMQMRNPRRAIKEYNLE